jgi:hypothetical protein
MYAAVSAGLCLSREPFISLFVVHLIILGYPADRTLARTLQLIVTINSGNGARA